MSTVGYERASTKSIAAKAGLAPGLVHYHFKSKQEILLALIDRLIEDAEDRFEQAMMTDESCKAKLTAFVTTRVGLGATADAEQVKAWVSILAEAMAQTKVRNRVSKWLSGDHSHLSTLLAEAGSATPAEHAATLLAMILGSFSLFAINVNGIPRGYAEPQILQWLDLAISRPVRRKPPGR
jgi:TetR/AcrR family transcriptional repressor of bet genes